MSVYMFPGQGSQRQGMGRELFADFPELTLRASEILGYSIDKLCLENPDHLLDKTTYTQPAIYFVNALHFLRRQQGGAGPPSHAIGHSLGEYNALHASGVFDLETGLRLVKKRGEVMGRVDGGAMAAVIGLHRAEVLDILRENSFAADIEIANDNAPTQVVISGSQSAIAAAQPVFKTLHKRVGYAVLKTSGAFHSRYMAEAQSQFASYLADSRFSFSEPTFPVLANTDVKPYVRSRVEVNLVEQITRPVRWTETIRHLTDAGESDFVEIGTGRVLTALLEKIRTAVPG